MTAEELAQVEKAVNEKIAENIPVVTKLMTLDEAKKSGAMALFGENTVIRFVLYAWTITPRSSVAVPMFPTPEKFRHSRSFPRAVLLQVCAELKR